MAKVTVSELYIHPVKSLAGIHVERFSLGRMGPQYDRRWMVVNAAGKFLTQRQYPKMCFINTQIEDGVLTLSAPNFDTFQVAVAQGVITQVRVWHDIVSAQDCGDDVADWLSQFLGISARLVYMPEQTDRLVAPDYAVNSETVSFADGFPLLIISQASLDLLNQKLDHRIGMQRFRPNIVVSGCEPHAEDTWHKIKIAGQTLSLVKPCSRCIIPSIDPLTSEKQAQVVDVLREYRQQAGEICFGQNALIEHSVSQHSVSQHSVSQHSVSQQQATLSVGDAVAIIE